MIDPQLRGKNVLVVGGSSGIGNGIAQTFRTEGANVHVWGTRPDAASYSGEDGCDFEGLGYSSVDVTSVEAIAAAAAPFATLDILVLSQGTVLYRRQEFQPEGWDKVIAVNLNSIMYCAHRFHDDLAASKGKVIVINSVASTRAMIANPAYAASKAGAAMLTRNLALSWASQGIQVNGIAPSLVETKLTKVTFDNEKRRTEALAQIPAGRLGEMTDVTGVALFLASPLSAFVYGQTILVDGGLTL